MYKNLLLNIKRYIGYVTINRPNVLNAIDENTFHELRRALREFRNNEKIKVIIITGTGRSFSAGVDLKSIPGLPFSKRIWNAALGRQILLEIKTGIEFEVDPVEYFEKILKGKEIKWKIGENWKPVISQINGYALGGGLEIACACDFRYAGESAILGYPEVDLNIFPAWGGTQFTTEILGVSMAKNLIYTCEKIPAGQAKKIGLIHKVFKNENLADETFKFARSLVKKDQKALKDVKTLVEQSTGEKLIRGLALEYKYTCGWEH